MKHNVYHEMTLLTQEEQKAIRLRHMENGVVFPCPDSVFIGREVKIEKGAVILPGCCLTGHTVICEGCVIGPNSLLHDCFAARGSEINASQCFESTVGEETQIGPFAHIRPGCTLGSQMRIGNFVEIKNSSVGEGTKISHLTYVGDSDIGKKVNFGCGCATVNFDGRQKHRTSVRDGAFIGCHTDLIAPVTVGKRAYTAAGSVITQDVPEEALAIGRARQINKEGWVRRKAPYRD